MCILSLEVVQMVKSYINLKEYPDFIKVWIAGLVNTIGDNFDALALSWLIYEVTGSKYWFAINFTLNAIPNLLIQPFLGVFIERMSKKTVMVLTDLGRAILVGILIFLISIGVNNPYLILCFTFAMTCLETLRQPASTALIPHILDSEDYEVGTSARQITGTLVALVSTALAGIVIGTFGTVVALWVDALSFILSALILSTLKTDAKNPNIEGQSYKKSLSVGWNTFVKHPYFIKLTAMTFLLQLFLTGVNIVLTPMIVEVLHGGPKEIAYINTVFLVGSLLGAFVYPLLAKKYKTYVIFLGSGAFGSLGLALIGLVPDSFNMFLTTAVLFLILSLGFGVLNPCLSVSLMRSVDKEQLARVSSFLNAAIYGSMPLGSLLTTLFMIQLSLPVIMSLYGIILLGIIFLFRNDEKLQGMV